MNYSWFASAYDTDDWAFRVATMVQMVGVIILALGLPQVFHSIDADTIIDNSGTVAGYVVMRLSMIFLWLRAARQDQPREWREHQDPPKNAQAWLQQPKDPQQPSTATCHGRQ